MLCTAFLRSPMQGCSPNGVARMPSPASRQARRCRHHYQQQQPFARSSRCEPPGRQPPPGFARHGHRASSADSHTAPLHELSHKAVVLASAVTLLLVPVNFVAAAEAPPLLVGTARVVDGDTLKVANEKIRLFGVDAPEKAQTCTDGLGKGYSCGEVSQVALQQKLERQTVSCSVRNRDQYGRAVATCAVGGNNGEDLGRWLVSNGYAVAYREFSQAYVPDEDAAAKAKRGIWQGSFQEPKEWRKETRSSTDSASAPSRPLNAVAASSIVAASKPPDHPPGCDIKGNIGSTGEKIYHVPKGRYYERTRIETGKGEKWFCSEAEAVKAGWRASRE